MILPFQSTLPARGATRYRGDWKKLYAFQSTLPARGATPVHRILQMVSYISIHAPCTGSDVLVCDSAADNFHFNPRSLHGERRYTGQCSHRPSNHFNPRSLHGERPKIFTFRIAQILFQSTLPARGATQKSTKPAAEITTFQSTLPARGATTLRMLGYAATTFQSTLPARGATGWTDCAKGNGSFQSTLPARGATGEGQLRQEFVIISIHAPCTGSDGILLPRRSCTDDFNPRSLHGERPLARLFGAD